MTPLVALVALLLACPLLSARPPAADDALAEPLTEQVRAYAAPLVEAGILPGLMIGVSVGDSTHWVSLGEGVPGEAPDADTLYEIGSLTKAFTGLLLAAEIADGALDEDAPLGPLLPEDLRDAPIADEAVLLRHLASHQSGLAREPDNLVPREAQDADDRFRDYDEARLWVHLARHGTTAPLTGTPGESFQYSNTGAGLLGTLLAMRAGTSYEELVKARITQPLGLVDTTITLSDAQRARLAPPTSGGIPTSAWRDMGALAPCGALRSTARDLMALGEAFCDAPDETWAARFALAAAPRVQIGAGQAYAFGWFLAGDRATRWHGGRTGGYSAHLAWNAQAGIVVCVLANGTSLLIDEMGLNILRMAAGIAVPPLDVRQAISMSEEALDHLTGRYLGERFEMTITRDAGGLLATLTGQGPLRIEPATPTRFFYRAVPAEIVFDMDDDGSVRSATLHQGGAAFVCPRVVEEGG